MITLKEVYESLRATRLDLEVALENEKEFDYLGKVEDELEAINHLLEVLCDDDQLEQFRLEGLL
jgi:hypothetical protein